MHKPSIFYIILAGFLWGSAVVFSKVLGGFGFTPLQMTALRNTVAALALFFYILISNPKQLKADVKEIIIFVISGACILFTGTFYYTAMEMTSPSTAVVLMYIAPIIVMGVSVLFMGERFNKQKGVAVAFAFIGCGLVTGIVGGVKFQLVGILMGILSGIAYASYNICAKIEMKRGNDAVTASFYCFFGAAVIGILISNPVTLFETVAQNSPQALPYIVAQGLFTGAIPYFLYTLASKRLPAGVASAMGTTEPMSATLISVLFYNDKIGLQGFVGIILIIGAVLLLSKSEE